MSVQVLLTDAKAHGSPTKSHVALYISALKCRKKPGVFSKKKMTEECIIMFVIVALLVVYAVLYGCHFENTEN